MEITYLLFPIKKKWVKIQFSVRKILNKMTMIIIPSRKSVDMQWISLSKIFLKKLKLNLTGFVKFNGYNFTKKILNKTRQVLSSLADRILFNQKLNPIFNPFRIKYISLQLNSIFLQQLCLPSPPCGAPWPLMSER